MTAGGMSVVRGAEVKKTQHPWPYRKLNIDHIGEVAYESWFKNFCCYAVANGIFMPLQETIGEPYTSFPIISTRWGHGGAVAWGTLCGTLIGAGIVTGLVAGKDRENILNDVIAWYTETELPIYSPSHPKGQFKNTNKSDSPLCHTSVGRWLKKEGVMFFAPQRKERYARISADVAMHTTKLLNDWADGKYIQIHGSQITMHGITTQSNCTDCHGD